MCVRKHVKPFANISDRLQQSLQYSSSICMCARNLTSSAFPVEECCDALVIHNTVVTCHVHLAPNEIQTDPRLNSETKTSKQYTSVRDTTSFNSLSE